MNHVTRGCAVVLAAACVLGFSAVRAAGLSPPELKRLSYHSEATGLERDYYVYLPEGFAQRDHWPVMLVLDGNGERGDGKDELDYVLVGGPLFEAWTQQRHLPFVIVAPQLPMFHQAQQGFITSRSRARIRHPRPEGPYPPAPPGAYRGKVPMEGQLADPHLPFGLDGTEEGWSMIESELLAILDATVANFRGDPARVYLTGYSTGGFGTWYLAGKHPERF
ncbi:MAG TPA: hypothetical protein VG710_08465, partial [Opitutus sp.]|nr:hypothetical protein [Opitutus sp.]